MTHRVEHIQRRQTYAAVLLRPVADESGNVGCDSVRMPLRDAERLSVGDLVVVRLSVTERRGLTSDDGCA